MGIDIDTSKKWMDIRRRAHDMSQSTMDEANETGDYSKVDRMNSIMDRISALGDHHAEQIGQAHDEDRAAESEAPSPDFAPAQTDVAWQDEPPQANLAPPAPPTPAATTPGLLPDMGSEVHEAARGATKGAIEAIKGDSALPSLGYAPGALSLRKTPSPEPSQEEQARVGASGSLGYAPGELKMESALPSQQQSALPSVEDQEVEAYLKSTPAEREAEMKERMANLFPKKDDSALPVDIMSLPASEEPAEPESALPDLEAERQAKGEEFAKNMGRDPISGKPVQDGEEGTPALSASQRDQATPVLADALKKNPAGTMSELGKYASTSPQWEQEYLRRVALEIGSRPKQSVLEKLAIALTLGAGSIISAWVTHRYNGQALVDLNADQKEWDKRKGEIAKETYLANKGLEKAEISPAASLERTEMTEKGKGQRLDKTEAGKGTRLETTEKGKSDRQTKDLESKERVAGIRAATTGKNLDRLSSGDRAKIEELKMRYNALDRMLLQYDPKVKSQGEAILKEIEQIIQQYPQKGK